FAKSKFILLLDEMSRLEEAATVANRIVRNFNAPFTLGSDELVLNLNVGIACYPISGESTLELVRNASASLAFLDKASEKNAFHYYNEVIDARADERLKFEEHLEEAFKNESLYLDYQPIIDLDTQMLYGVEALLRWRSEEYGEVSPERIIPIAEESGLIVDLGYWIIERVFQQYIEWQNTMRPFRVSINITPRQLYDVTWRDTILALIKKYQIDPNFIIFELTERDIFSDLDRTNEQLRELAMLGCHLFIDDYGTGFSSINLIRRLPISGLKIDKSFVQGVDHDPEDAGLVKSILDLADNLNLVVIAEGVEKESQLEFIQSSSRGKKAQGFFFDRPMTPEAIQKRYSRAK
ncbi:MAG: EAL domain-containing protein, partial [Coxiellaceae bacterium]|nr:EAL domain-containing protein [Coxiellaceae bacterium]